MTFNLISHATVEIRYEWQSWYEAFCICRNCSRSTVFILSENGIDESKAIRQAGLAKLTVAANQVVSVKSYVSLKDAQSIAPPDYLPADILAVFSEGATCLAVGCFNAAGTMFRLSVDLSTKSLLPEADCNGLNSKIRRNLGLRLPWLFEQGLLSTALKDLSACIKEDGNDGAHDGSLGREDAEDLLDFTFALLERMYTEPERLRLAKERRDTRRAT